jgi:hypothetical protein
MQPFGNPLGVPVFVDRSLAEDEDIEFRARTHTDTMSVPYADFERARQPALADPRAHKRADEICPASARNHAVGIGAGRGVVLVIGVRE